MPVIRGVDRLSGAPVRASDIRAGVALVVAGLAAEGETVVSDPHHIDRGYEDFVGKLSALGADVRRERARRLARYSRPASRASGPATKRISSQPPWWASTSTVPSLSDAPLAD